MMSSELSQKRAIDLTGEELAEIILQKISPEIIRPRRILKGIKGISLALGVGMNRAVEIHESGIIKEAIARDGRLLFVDADLASAIYFEYQKKHEGGFKSK